MAKKQKILINASRMDTSWAGGLYYARNVAFQLSQNDYIRSSCRLIVTCNAENRSVFSDLDDVQLIVPGLFNKILGRYYIYALCLLRRIKYVYWGNRDLTRFGIQTIAWIPDFQEKHYPEFFPAEEVQARDAACKKVAACKVPLILSSEAARKDFRTYYSEEKKNVYVMPFVSYIKPAIDGITEKAEKDTLDKFDLNNIRYACTMNQFWQHKNHKVLLEAIRILFTEAPETDFRFVFTGSTEDYRNPEYNRRIQELINDPAIRPHVMLLGFVSKQDQIIIMKNAEFVIQPTLFEGWGTVVEEAKVLDKTILLSDIPVHHEQMNEKCTLFNPDDAGTLAELIRKEIELVHKDDIEKGIQSMFSNAKDYTKEFEQLLKDTGGNG